MRLLVYTTAIGLLSFVIACPIGQAQQATQPDNTRMNQVDRDAGRETADQQMANHSDSEITQQIRRSIIQDTNLSTYAHNVKVITRNGEVTLRGPVRSEEERQFIENKAKEVAGRTHVKNELRIAAAKR